MTASRDKRVKLGRIAGAHGVKGWVKVASYTQPRENIVGFGEWILERDGDRRRVEVERSDSSGKRILAKIGGIDDRDQAEAWVGSDICVAREALPACGPGEYYWADLEGLEVVALDGTRLGRVDHLLATGRYDVLVLDSGKDRLIPFVADRVVRKVDLENGIIEVDWDLSYWEP